MWQPADGEAEALREIGARVDRVRAWVAGASVAVGLAAGIGGYVALRAFLLAHAGAHSPVVTSAVTVGLAFPVSFFAAKQISRLLVRRRADAWIAAARARHALLSVDPLREYLDLYR